MKAAQPRLMAPGELRTVEQWVSPRLRLKKKRPTRGPKSCLCLSRKLSQSALKLEL